MLKANELMIGDWYAFRGHPYKCTAFDIASLAECEEKGAPTDISELPLTPEILEKNGFRYNDTPFIQGWEQFGLTLYRGGNGYRINCGINVVLIIDAVHQLQHALQLCGIDKEIII